MPSSCVLKRLELERETFASNLRFWAARESRCLALNRHFQEIRRKQVAAAGPGCAIPPAPVPRASPEIPSRGASCEETSDSLGDGTAAGRGDVLGEG